MEWNRRVACEKEMDKEDDERAKQPVAFCWDYTSNFILYPSIIGIKVVSNHTFIRDDQDSSFMIDERVNFKKSWMENFSPMFFTFSLEIMLIPKINFTFRSTTSRQTKLWGSSEKKKRFDSLRFLFASKFSMSFLKKCYRSRAVPDVRARLQGAATTIETEAAENPNLNKPNDPDPLFVGLFFYIWNMRISDQLVKTYSSDLFETFDILEDLVSLKWI